MTTTPATSTNQRGLFAPDASGEAAGPARLKPTVVLVHGAFADASSLNGVIHRLQQAGYPVLAPANPLRGVASDAAYIASILDTLSGPIVLVGHSYGGAVITNAAANHPGVSALVYLAAFAPDQDEDGLTMVSRFPGSQVVPPGQPGATLIGRPAPLLTGGTGIDLYIDPARFHEIFAADLSAETVAAMAAGQRPVADAVFSDKSGVPAWKSVPSWAVVATGDQVIGAANVRFMAERAGAQITEVNASHAVMVSQPQAVADVIEAAAAAVTAKP
jgi:pimeloyl-ACP methyl ester carboxylesterase